MNRMLATLAVLAALALAACSPADTSSPTTAGTPADGSTGPKASAASPAQPEDKVLNFSNWVDYIPEDMLKQFEQETGITVNYRTYGGNEDLQKQVELRSSNDDLVVPSVSYGKTQAELGMYLPLDKSLLPNFKNLDADMLKSLAVSDPGNKYFVPWAWGYTTLFLNKTKVSRALAGMPYPSNEWDLVFKPEYTSRLKSCGIAFLDSPSEIIPLAMRYMGLDPYSENEADYARAADMLKPVRRDIGTFSLKMIDVMSSGDVCVAVAWSGDIDTSITELRDKGVKDDLVGVQPSSGTLMFVDVLAIPVNASHPRNAHAFIDFYLKAANSAKLPNEVGFANGNQAALEFVDAEVKQNPLIYPPPEFMARLTPSGGYSAKARWAMMYSYMAFAYNLDKK